MGLTPLSPLFEECQKNLQDWFIGASLTDCCYLLTFTLKPIRNIITVSPLVSKCQLLKVYFQLIESRAEEDKESEQSDG